MKLLQNNLQKKKNIRNGVDTYFIGNCNFIVHLMKFNLKNLHVSTVEKIKTTNKQNGKRKTKLEK